MSALKRHRSETVLAGLLLAMGLGVPSTFGGVIPTPSLHPVAVIFPWIMEQET